jgi:PD-(D/E)XK nuclease superfamily
MRRGSWPDQRHGLPPPNELSVSSLGEIEACPRRWALASADYPEVWDRRGYPPRLFLGGLAGSVVHSAIRTVTRALARAGCSSLEDANAVAVMRGLGGYTKVINNCVDQVLHRFSGNPRAAPLLEFAVRSLQSRIPKMRAEAQTFLGSVKFHGWPPTSGVESVRKPRSRIPLGPGTYTELELRAPRIGWHGVADLLMLSTDNCEIVDFKTGSPDESHRFQLRVYALLWSRDSELNPTHRPVDALTLSYQGHEVTVDPPTAAELDALESELVDRRQAAANALNDNPPQARPSVENCNYCVVRHLCEEYWHPATLQVLSAAAPTDSPFADLQITIVGRHGPSSWDGIIEHSRGSGSGKPIVLRTALRELQFAKGNRIRVLDAHVPIVTDNEAQAIVATMTQMSEIFFLSARRLSSRKQRCC